MLHSQKLAAEIKTLSEQILTPDAPVQPAVKEFLRCAYDAAMRAHYAGSGGIAVCEMHALAVDIALRYLVDIFVQKRGARGAQVERKFCVAALGGYGRRELCPKSDIDIMILYSPRASDRMRTLVVDEIMYPLWNAGLTLGHSSRTPEEAIDAAASDVLTRTAMLDARFVGGNKRLFAAFERSFKKLCSAGKAAHFDELMRLKRNRHAKSGWTPYVQEPNIKNGIGGLRDAQTMAWKTRLNFGNGNIRELAARKIISLPEYKAVRRAYDFLLRVRNDMHYLSGRENDMLDIETQAKIAPRLGFNEGDEEARVGDFMRQVYYAFRAIDSVAKTARKRMGISLPDDVLEDMRRLGARRPRNKKYTVDGFSIYRGEIDALRPTIFKTKPARLIRVFRYSQIYGAAPSDKLEVLIKDSRKYIDDVLRDDPEVNAAFLEILETEGDVFPALELMHYWGVLNAFIPEFRDITCMVQHEFYHRYTADIHILNSLGVLDKVFCARPNDGIYWDYHKVLISAQSPNLAYLILFLHDIGKADGIRGHAEVGAEIGARLLKRFNIPESDAETVLFAVRNHLEMARFWQSHDVEDERAVEKFAAIVENEENLKYLYVITFCDAMATSESFWNSYKQSLHSMLYGATSAYLQKGEGGRADTYNRRRTKTLRAALASPEIAGMEGDLYEHIENLPRNYFYHHGLDDLVSHVHMVNTLRRRINKDDTQAAPVIEWRDDPNSSTSRLCVVSTDRSGLFATLAGALTLSGLDILGSKILTRADGITIDTFYVAGVSDGVLNNPNLRDRFSRMLAGALRGKISLDREVNDLFYNSRRNVHGDVVRDVFLRRESGKLIVDVRAVDCVGILYRLARTIHDCGYDITFARVITEGGWGQNTFHVQPHPLADSTNELTRSLKAIF